MPSGTPLRVVIAGGGTGGHLYPGLAIARELARQSPDARVSFAGTSRGLEARVIPREGFEVDVIRSGGLKGQSAVAVVRSLATLPLSLWDAWRLIRRRAPDLVIGVGGYSSGPVVFVAAVRGVPTLLLEQNAVPGLTNRLLSRFVRAAAVTDESTAQYFGDRSFVSGNPVRPEFLEAEDPDSREAAPSPSGACRLLVFGGSQGAHAINVAMMEAAPELAAAGVPVAITHQTGERDRQRVHEAYRAAGLDARVEAFLHSMGREMRAADLLVCRAGATTLAEVAAAGRAAVVIPLPTATDDHQRKNAELLARAGAVELIDQGDLTGRLLAMRIAGLARDPARRAAMGRAARGFARPDAARTIVDRALALVAR